MKYNPLLRIDVLPLFYCICACDTQRPRASPHSKKRRSVRIRSTRQQSPEPVRPHHIEKCIFPHRETPCKKKTKKTEALHAQISETLRDILSDDEFAVEAPG
jgi:hypothetical protein